ncbi:MAG: hypothetical protein ACLFRX_06810 [Gemmatimonadota bacterium]
MGVRHLLFRITPRLDGRWLVAVLVVAVVVVAATFIRWSGPAPPLDLLALGPEGRFADTVEIPAAWGDTATATPDAVARVPLMLGVRNRGREPVRPERLSLSLPLRYRLTGEAGKELDSRLDPGSPLITYTLRSGLGRVEPERLPVMLSGHDTLWLEIVIPSYYCISLADSIPEFVPAPPPPVHTLRELRIFYSFAGGDLGERRTGTLAVRLDTALLDVEALPRPPSFEMENDAEAARPELRALTRVGSRKTSCGEPGSAMELLSTVWETPDGGRFITLDYGGKVRKRLYDLDGDGVIERESWAPGGSDRFTATRRAALPIPEFLLPIAPGGTYDMTAIDTLPADSITRLDPFRRAMRGPGEVPGGVLGPGTDSAARALLDPRSADTTATGTERTPTLEELPEPRIRPAGPLGRPARPDTVPPDTGGG